MTVAARRETSRQRRTSPFVQTGPNSSAPRQRDPELVVIGHGGIDPGLVEEDQELLLWLSNDGLDGEAWKALCARVLPVGINTIRAMANDGSMMRHLRRLNVNTTVALRRILRERNYEEVHDLAVQTAMDALDYWRRRVIPEGRWRPESQLSTYFVNACLMRAPRSAERIRPQAGCGLRG